MMEDNYNSYLYVNLNTLKTNAEKVISGLGDAQLIPVLKSDAFGLGLTPTAKALAELPEIKWFAAAHVSEGLELRDAGIDKDILIIGCALPCQLSAAVDADLTLAAPYVGFLTKLDEAAAALGKTAKFQIKLDTGLHRIGVEPGEELAALLEEFKASNHLSLEGIYSHMAEPENLRRTAAQVEQYKTGLAQLEAAGITAGLRHMSCSAAAELYSEYNFDAVRVGRGLFFDNPTSPTGKISELASWRSAVVMVKQRHAGDVLGYGSGHVLEKDALVASIGVGYGDGLDVNSAKYGAPVLIHGKRCPILYCSMDQSLVDVSGANCAVGDEVTLFGYSSDGAYLSAQTLAGLIGANEGCGLTTALTKRVQRVYIK